jgi:hypothetical protein
MQGEARPNQILFALIVHSPKLANAHITVLLDKLGDQAEREWYVAAVEHGWYRNLLLNQIMNRLQTRAGAAPSNSPPGRRPHTPSSPQLTRVVATACLSLLE